MPYFIYNALLSNNIIIILRIIMVVDEDQLYKLTGTRARGSGHTPCATYDLQSSHCFHTYTNTYIIQTHTIMLRTLISKTVSKRCLNNAAITKRSFSSTHTFDLSGKFVCKLILFPLHTTHTRAAHTYYTHGHKSFPVHTYRHTYVHAYIF